jgi:hypothetical protein
MTAARHTVIEWTRYCGRLLVDPLPPLLLPPLVLEEPLLGAPPVWPEPLVDEPAPVLPSDLRHDARARGFLRATRPAQ